MNPELLKHYIALQPFFRERMGGLQDYDKAVFVEEPDKVHRYVSNSNVGVSMNIAEDYDRLIRLPRTIDDSSEEDQKRSLAGMLNYQWALSNPCPAIGVDSYGLLLFDNKGEEEIAYYEGATPTEAILRALCAQEGVEV